MNDLLMKLSATAVAAVIITIVYYTPRVMAYLLIAQTGGAQ
ncbi:hypothetical protein [Spirabiliibacterium mucosae]|nr:hypothetical protein [Spirabiliibacterium mucosae]